MLAEVEEMVAKPFRIIAHRGASGYAPENTMAAFELALKMGANEVETDVQFTKDRKVIIFHDTNLDRITNGKGPVSNHTLEELRRLDAGSWFKPPLGWERSYAGEKIITLEELLGRFGTRLTYHVEIKEYQEGLVAATLAIIEKVGLVHNCFITAIDKRSTIEARRLAPKIRVGWAVPRSFNKGTLDEAKRLGFNQVIVDVPETDPDVVKYGQEIGLEIRAAAIRDREGMLRALEAGCNGMTINWPDWLIEYLKSKESKQTRN